MPIKLYSSQLNPEKFTSILIDWSEANPRNLPWKKDRDPYKIWISEIILQQTRVAQGIPYYLRFVQKFPDLKSLAFAKEEEVMKAWEGLGYYSRARNLHFTAQYIVQNLNANFPTHYKDILNLKGIGPYTAAAISSFAFDQKFAVVDGNVLRLISRLLGILEPIDHPKVRKVIDDFVNTSIKKADAAKFNQALMDFGATLCTSSNPKCDICPLQSYCVALQQDLVKKIPSKSKKIHRTNRYFHFFDLDFPNQLTIIIQRKETDIWKKLFQFPAMESKTQETPDLIEIKQYLNNLIGETLVWNGDFKQHYSSKQILTHQNVYAYFYKIKIETSLPKINKDLYLVERAKVSNFAFPKIISDYLKNTIT